LKKPFIFEIFFAQQKKDIIPHLCKSFMDVAAAAAAVSWMGS